MVYTEIVGFASMEFHQKDTVIQWTERLAEAGEEKEQGRMSACHPITAPGNPWTSQASFHVSTCSCEVDHTKKVLLKEDHPATKVEAMFLLKHVNESSDDHSQSTQLMSDSAKDYIGSKELNIELNHCE